MLYLCIDLKYNLRDEGMKYGEIKELTFDEFKKLGLKFNYADDGIIVMDFDERTIDKISSRIARSFGNLFTFDFTTITIVYEGSVTQEREGNSANISNSIIITGPHFMTNNSLRSNHCVCRTLIISTRKTQELLCQYASMWSQIMVMRKIAILSMTPQMRDNVMALNKAFETRAKGMEIQLESVYTATLVKALLLESCVVLRASVEGEMPRPVYGEQRQWLMQHFLSILAEEPAKRHPVSYYARKLGVTPKYLSTVCKEQSHQTAGKWLKYYMNQQIHQLLAKSDLSIHEAAMEAGFENDSFFSSYVRRNFGCTPSELCNRENKI